MGRHEYRDIISSPSLHSDDGCYPRTPKEFGEGAMRWFKKYAAGDIFGDGNSPAARSLDKFLGMLESIKLPEGRSLHFVQIGDMYDYWIGLEQYFSQLETHTIAFDGRSNEAIRLDVRQFVNFWAERTQQAMQGDNCNVVVRLNQLSQKIPSSFLWGNHDNYLAKHTPIVSGGPPIPTRVPQIRTGGVLIEHGQRGDPENRDGESSGHATTMKVFNRPVFRSLDPNRRNLFTALAGVSYVSNPDFHVYVMGHTHSPFLTRLRIDVVLTR
jgi:hypothetical protein